MRSPILVLLAVSVLAFCALPSLACDVSADDSGATVTGYVEFIGEGANIHELVVTLYYPEGTGYSTRSCVGINDNGLFTINNVPDAVISQCYVSLVVNAFTVFIMSSSFDGIPDYTISSGVPCYKLSTEKYGDEHFVAGSTYTISSLDDDATNKILMRESFGSLTGKVLTDSATPIALNGATASVKDSFDGSLVAKGSTNGTGQFTISKCPTGTYTLLIEMSGYTSYEMPVTIGNGTVTDVKEINLTPSGGYYGIDIQHIMAIIGGCIAVFLILAGLYFYNRARTGRTNIICDKKDQ